MISTPLKRKNNTNGQAAWQCSHQLSKRVSSNRVHTLLWFGGVWKEE